MGVLIELLIEKMRRETLGDLIHISEPGAGTIAQSRAFPASRNKPLECITWADMSEF